MAMKNKMGMRSEMPIMVGPFFKRWPGRSACGDTAEALLPVLSSRAARYLHPVRHSCHFAQIAPVVTFLGLRLAAAHRALNVNCNHTLMLTILRITNAPRICMP